MFFIETITKRHCAEFQHSVGDSPRWCSRWFSGERFSINLFNVFSGSLATLEFRFRVRVLKSRFLKRAPGIGILWPRTEFSVRERHLQITKTWFVADRPVTYLYNTLHYYERQLRDRTNLKRKLVHAIMSSLKVATSDCVSFHSWDISINSLCLRTTGAQVGVSVRPTSSLGSTPERTTCGSLMTRTTASWLDA